VLKKLKIIMDTGKIAHKKESKSIIYGEMYEKA